MAKCAVDGCESETYREGKRFKFRAAQEFTAKYCRKHYSWFKARGTTDPHKFSQGSKAERFWWFVDKKSDDECWNWTGTLRPNGYGHHSGGATKGVSAHRFSYELHHGAITDGMLILHSCDNRKCVNPKHLRQGTQSENIQEAFDKGRKKQPVAFGEDNPKSKLTLEQVKFIKANPQIGNTDIARMFNLSPNCIRGVRIGRTWKSVT